MGLSSNTASAAVRSDINVTPLVDVMLVLLIIFMVVTPMLSRGPAVQMPLTSTPPPMPEDKTQTLVGINQAGELWIDKERIPENNFEAMIKETFDRNPSNSVVIKADARLSYGDVKKRMLQVKNAGFNAVGLITSKRDSANLK